MAILTLAVGVGANVAIYSVVKAVLLDPLPYAEPDRLAFIAEAVPDTPDKPDIDYAVVTELARRATVIDSVASYEDGVGDLIETDQPEVVRSLHVSSNFFATLGVPLALGRTFSNAEQADESRGAVILSYSFWQRRFGGDPTIIGRVLRFDDQHPVVVGVLPQTFEPLIKGNSELLPEMYAPLRRDPDAPCHRCQGVRAIARLKAGVSPAQVEADLTRAFIDLRQADPVNHHPRAMVVVTPLRERLLGRMVMALSLAFAAVGLVLLIACANVASLALARAFGREKEMSVRMALGGSTGRMAAQLLIESLVVSAAAGIIGGVAAVWATPVLASLVPPQVPRVGHIQIDGAVLLFALGISVGTGVLFGLAPMLWVVRGGSPEGGHHGRRWHDPLRGGRASTGRASRRALDGLVIVEIALAFVLVVAATLVSRSYVSLMRVDPGYDSNHVLTLTTRVWSRTYGTSAAAQRYYDAALARVEALPGIESAAFTSAIPMDQPTRVAYYLAGTPLAAEASAPLAQQYSVSPGYFNVMRIPLLRGRLFSAEDTPASPRVAIVNAAFARQAYAGGNPIGRQIKLGDLEGPRPWLTIVGMVGDVRHDSLDAVAGPQVYIAEPQDLLIRFYRLVARTTDDPGAWEQPVAAAFLALDRQLPVYHVKSLDAYVAGTVAERTFATAWLLLFGALAVLLALAGVYGLISYSTALRVREFGVRLALGAPPTGIVVAVLRHACVIAGWGLALGAAASLALGRTVDSLLFGITAFNPPTYAGVALLVALTTLAASAIPARRASRLDPAVGLRDP